MQMIVYCSRFINRFSLIYHYLSDFKRNLPLLPVFTPDIRGFNGICDEAALFSYKHPGSINLPKQQWKIAQTSQAAYCCDLLHVKLVTFWVGFLEGGVPEKPLCLQVCNHFLS